MAISKNHNSVTNRSGELEHSGPGHLMHLVSLVSNKVNTEDQERKSLEVVHENY